MIIIRFIEMIFTTLFRDVETIIATVLHFAVNDPLCVAVPVLALGVVALAVLDSRTSRK